MTYDRYEGIARTIKHYKSRVEDLIIEFKDLKRKWSAKDYNEAQHQLVNNEVARMLTHEYERVKSDLYALPGRNLEDEKIRDEVELELHNAHSNLYDEYKIFKKEVELICGGGKK